MSSWLNLLVFNERPATCPAVDEMKHSSFMAGEGMGSVLEYLAASGGELGMADLEEMMDMCQIATCHERGERYVRQMGHYVACGGVLRIKAADERGVIVIDDLEALRALILRRDGALDIVSNPSLRPARE
jgi:hypothetical protein